ncbi:MAG: class I SAM-dependent methyltransferase [Deltaproteobacteria bacterium]|nr:class I SAM-dependent methyltransferase [Deltaproteobacteria bacterium]
MKNNREHIYDGWIYHLAIDMAMARVRRLIKLQIDAGSTLIDIGCGTGELLFSLADRCSRLVGVERSKGMWTYASRRASNYPRGRLQFIFGDGADLDFIPFHAFDYATVCMVFHEVTLHMRPLLLREVRRIARTTIMVDYRVPFPKRSLRARSIHLIERLAGRQHYGNFRSFLTTGGLPALVAGEKLSVLQEIPLQGNCLHLLRAE